jgi:FKBP-type peptidyl-prolyl cis-trans isomerase
MRFGAILAVFLGASTAAVMAADPTLSPQANAGYLAAYAHKPGAVRTADGLEYRIIQHGNGARPAATDLVDVYYRGTLINGKLFDQTKPGVPAQFPVNGVIPGWTEALLLMREGDRWELVIPADLAYGSSGAGDAVPPDQTLVFEVSLVKVTHP